MAFQDEKDAHILEQMTDEAFWQRARAEAARVAPALSPSESGVSHQYLTCELQHGTCFVPLAAIEAVVPASSSLARLPFAPSWLQGMQAWRGEIIAVVSLDSYLSGLTAPLSGGMLLIVRHPECAIGLRVPGVGLTTFIELEQMMPTTTPSALYTSTRVSVVKGLYDAWPVLDIVPLLDDVALSIEMAAHHD